MSEIITFSPTASIFGFGALKRLPDTLKLRGFKRVLIITDPEVTRVGILQKSLDLLKGSFDVEVFDEAPAEPHSSDVDQQKQHFGSDFDALLGLGGGSAMDFAKAIAIIMTHGGSLGDYLGEGSVPGPVIPVVCVPTTSGTGSQNTQTTVFTIEGIKRGASSLGGMIDAPHGVCLAACTHIGLSYNFEACENKYAILAGYMGNGDHRSSQPSPESFIDNLIGLINDFDLPSKPSQLGLKREDAQTLLKNTLVQTRRIKTNPRPLDDELLSYIEKGI